MRERKTRVRGDVEYGKGGAGSRGEVWKETENERVVTEISKK